MSEERTTPAGYKRGEDGILRPKGGFSSERPAEANEAVMFDDGYGRRIGCSARVTPKGSSWHDHACGKVAKHDPDHNGNPTRCGVHSAAANARRKAKADAAYEAYRQKAAKTAKSRDLAREAQEIVKVIAGGHNDPRHICQEWLSKWEDANQ